MLLNKKDKKNTSNTNLEKKENHFKQKFLRELELNDYKMTRYSGALDFDSGWGARELEYLRKTIPDIFQACKEEKIWRQIIIDYFNVRDGQDNVTTHISDVTIQPIDFTFDVFDCPKKLENTKDIVSYISKLGNSRGKTFDFFFCYREEEKHLYSKEIDFKNIDFDKHYFDIYDSIIDEFKKDKVFMDNGIKVDSFANVGEEEVYIACDPNLLLDNMKTAFIFLKESRKEMLQNGVNVESILQNWNPGQNDFILNNKKLFTQLIAYNIDADKNIDNIKHDFNVKEILLDAIEINPNCYEFLPDVYTEDKDIIIKLLSKNIKFINLVFKFGVTDKDNFTDYIINYFKEK